MSLSKSSNRNRSLRPVLAGLEERALLNAAMPHHVADVKVASHVADVKYADAHKDKVQGPTVSVLNKVKFGGYQFLNFDGPDPGNTAGAGTNMNGISNNGTSVGFTISNSGTFLNFVANPLKSARPRCSLSRIRRQPTRSE